MNPITYRTGHTDLEPEIEITQSAIHLSSCKWWEGSLESGIDSIWRGDFRKEYDHRDRNNYDEQK